MENRVQKQSNGGLTACSIVKNEERWAWFSLMSVIDFVDQILVFDTGSTDKTVEIIKTIKDRKIVFEEKGEVSKKEFSTLRNEQLKRVQTEWFMLLDGDEIWPKDSIKSLREVIDKAPPEKQAVVVRYYDAIGDIYHHLGFTQKLIWPFSPEGKIGWMTVRAFRKTIPGLHCSLEYGREGFKDKDGVDIQARGENTLIFLDKYFFHTSFLPRSSSWEKENEVIMRKEKRKYELGIRFPKDFQHPEVFFLDRPKIVPSPFQKAPLSFWLKAAINTPIKRLRRWMWMKLYLR